MQNCAKKQVVINICKPLASRNQPTINAFESSQTERTFLIMAALSSLRKGDSDFKYDFTPEKFVILHSDVTGMVNQCLLFANIREFRYRISVVHAGRVVPFIYYHFRFLCIYTIFTMSQVTIFGALVLQDGAEPLSASHTEAQSTSCINCTPHFTSPRHRIVS